MDKVTGYVTGVNGNLVSASFSGSVRKNEVGYVLVGDDRLKGEVIRVNGDTASMQIYEMTNGIQVGDKVELSGELMSVELGPGLLTQVFDGLQNPLPELAEKVGEVLTTMQSDMLERARKHRDSHTYDATTYEEFVKTINEKPGFVRAMWCGDQACEDKIKEDTTATSRCMPFKQDHIADTCVCCGKPAKALVYWGKAY